MMNQDFGKLVDGLGFVDIEVKDISQGIAERIRGVCLHVPNQIDQLCKEPESMP
jgi:hypothetical protein